MGCGSSLQRKGGDEPVALAGVEPTGIPSLPAGVEPLAHEASAADDEVRAINQGSLEGREALVQEIKDHGSGGQEDSGTQVEVIKSPRVKHHVEWTEPESDEEDRVLIVHLSEDEDSVGGGSSSRAASLPPPTGLGVAWGDGAAPAGVAPGRLPPPGMGPAVGGLPIPGLVGVPPQTGRTGNSRRPPRNLFGGRDAEGGNRDRKHKKEKRSKEKKSRRRSSSPPSRPGGQGMDVVQLPGQRQGSKDSSAWISGAPPGAARGHTRPASSRVVVGPKGSAELMRKGQAPKPPAPGPPCTPRSKSTIYGKWGSSLPGTPLTPPKSPFPSPRMASVDQAVDLMTMKASLVTEVDFTYMELGDAGAEALADAMRLNTTVSDLYLWNTKIGDPGVVALAAAMKVNQTLQSLVLDFNDVGDEGAKALAAAVQGHPKLRVLDLKGNRVGDQGARVLMDAVAKSPTVLESLDLTDNPQNIIPAEVVRNGGEAVVEFMREVGEEGGDVLPKVKWMLVGRQESGKTSLLRTLRDPHKATNLAPAWDRTILLDVGEWSPPNSDMKVSVWDSGGAEDYWRVGSQLFLTERRTLYVLTFDLSHSMPVFWEDNAAMGDPWTETHELEWLRQYVGALLSHAPGCRIALVGTKSDLVGMGKVRAKRSLFYRSGVIPPFPGWDPKDESREGKEDEEVEEELVLSGDQMVGWRLWRAATAIEEVIAAHRDALSHKLLTLERRLESFHVGVKQTRGSLWMREQASRLSLTLKTTARLVYRSATSANETETMTTLHGSLLALSSDSQVFKDVGNVLPKSWKRLSKEVAKAKVPLMTMQEFTLKFYKKCGFSYPQRFGRAVQFLHALGVLLNYRDSPALCGIVVTRPHWLVDAFKEVIRHDSRLSEDLGGHNARALRELRMEGRMKVDYDWGARLYPRVPTQVLLALMRHFDLCLPGPTRVAYLVPSLLPQAPPASAEAWHAQGATGAAVSMIVQPPARGLFERLIARCSALGTVSRAWRGGGGYGAGLGASVSGGAQVLARMDGEGRVLVCARGPAAGMAAHQVLGGAVTLSPLPNDQPTRTASRVLEALIAESFPGVLATGHAAVCPACLDRQIASDPSALEGPDLAKVVGEESPVGQRWLEELQEGDRCLPCEWVARQQFDASRSRGGEQSSPSIRARGEYGAVDLATRGQAISRMNASNAQVHEGGSDLVRLLDEHEWNWESGSPRKAPGSSTSLGKPPGSSSGTKPPGSSSGNRVGGSRTFYGEKPPGSATSAQGNEGQPRGSMSGFGKGEAGREAATEMERIRVLDEAYDMMGSEAIPATHLVPSMTGTAEARFGTFLYFAAHPELELPEAEVDRDGLSGRVKRLLSRGWIKPPYIGTGKGKALDFCVREMQMRSVRCAPMKILSWRVLDKLGEIPRHHEGYTVSILEAMKEVAELHRLSGPPKWTAYDQNPFGGSEVPPEYYPHLDSETGSQPRLKIMYVSHRWLRADADRLVAHPDNRMALKSKSLVDFARKEAESPSKRETYYWIDFSCNDDGDPKTGMFDSLPLFMGACTGGMVAVDTKEFEDRAWCRMEQALCATFSYKPMFSVITVLGRHGGSMVQDATKFMSDSKKPLLDPRDGELTHETDMEEIKDLVELCERFYGRGWIYAQGEMARLLKGVDVVGMLRWGHSEVVIEEHMGKIGGWDLPADFFARLMTVALGPCLRALDGRA